MRSPDKVILAEIPDIKQIVGIACAIEGAQQGTHLNPHDPKVQLRAAEIILGGAGAHLREVWGQQTQNSSCSA